MRLLVDTFNVLHQWHSGPAEPGHDVAALADLIARSRYAGTGVTLVCDGTASPANAPRALPPATRLIYSGGGREADDVIERLIAEHTAPRRLVVASSDRRIQAAAGRRGAAAISASDFLAQIIRDAAGPRPAPPTDRPTSDINVDAWADTFNLPPELRDLPSSHHPAPAPAPSPPPPPNRAAHQPAADTQPSEDQLIREALEGRAPSTGQSDPAADLDMERILKEHPPGGKPRKRPR